MGQPNIMLQVQENYQFFGVDIAIQQTMRHQHQRRPTPFQR